MKLFSRALKEPAGRRQATGTGTRASKLLELQGVGVDARDRHGDSAAVSLGSGKFGTPFWRMHAENFSAWAMKALAWAGVGAAGANDLQAFSVSHATVNRYDVVVLDRDLPGLHGDEVCKVLVAGGCESRLLMLTAASTVRDRVDGLGLGADDYLPKPFDFDELVARVRALGRRSPSLLPTVLENGDVMVDPARRVASRAGACC